MGRSRPTQSPPQASKKKEQAKTQTYTQPTELPPLPVEGASILSKPSQPLELIVVQEVVAEEASVGTWYNNQKVTALWSINENRNAWLALDGGGWKKLANNIDTATIALTILSGVAKQTQSTNVQIRDEADGMIHEIYVW